MGKRIELPFVYRKPQQQPVEKPSLVAAPQPKPAKESGVATAGGNGPFDKTAYQREYMRRYRARKAKK